MYSQEMLLVLLISLLSTNGELDLNNNNTLLILMLVLFGYPQFPIYWNNGSGCGCGCNRNRLFV